MSLKGKTALVTGAGRGIGKVIASNLAEMGCKIAVNDLPNSRDIANTISEFKSSGYEAESFLFSVTDLNSVKNGIQSIEQKWGPVDILVNNAGITSQDKFADIALERWNLIVNVNLNGSIYCAHAVLPQMVARNSGVIINMSSILATRVQYSVAYGTTKAALERFTTGLARELRRTNVSVSCLKPFFVKTEVVTGFLDGKTDMTDWEEPEMWGKYTAMIANADPQITTGKIFDQALLKQTLGPWQ
ncbi:MAG TPA: SDR family oxidoreductase [Dehalococcoidales bacterium]|nr:SDR family oxidoreductase [Dehalococcoidales bacterium]